MGVGLRVDPTRRRPDVGGAHAVDGATSRSRTLEKSDDESDVRWERPFRPATGPAAAGSTPTRTRRAPGARYAFRQRVVLALLVCALLTAVAAAAAKPVVWWAHGAIDLVLVVYLVYLRRQVRLEAAIRRRRAARMAGTRRTSGDRRA